MAVRSPRARALRLVKPPAALKAGLDEVVRLFPERFSDAKTALPVRFRALPKDAEKRVEVTAGADGATIAYTDAARAFRGLGRLMGRLAAGPAPEAFADGTAADFAGVMLDCSRNAVPTEARAREWIVRLALMGLDTLLFYTEDTYEVPGEPFFGYGRGGFTQAEMKRLDRFAASCGVELVPCIQTLGHLEQPLRWPAYADLADQPGVLMIDDPRTYELLEKMIAAASAPVRSKRIHVGMDEAHGVGLGRYQDRHGVRPRFDLMTRHLEKVRAICAEHGLTPWMWSDMFFRLGSKTNDYYDLDAKFPAGLAEKIPADVRQIYWDYYHLDEKFYRTFIQRHRELGSEPIVALGGWTWSCFWPMTAFAMNAVDAAMRAAAAEGAKETFLTLWGDDGSECDFAAAWPVVQHYAEHVYGHDGDEALRREAFLGATGGRWDDWLAVNAMERLPGYPDPGKQLANPAKWLLWQDPMLAYMDANYNPERAAAFYAKEARRLAGLAARGGRDGALLKLPALVAAALAAKAPLRARAAAFVKKGDKKAARAWLKKDLPAAVRAVKALWKHHRASWLAHNEPNGWEVLEHRYGGLLARLDTMGERVRAWCERGEAVPELTERFAPLANRDAAHFLGRYGHIATTSVLR